MLQVPSRKLDRRTTRESSEVRIRSKIKSEVKFQSATPRESQEDSMKNMFLLIVVPVLLVTLGFGQAYTPSSNTDRANIKGCIGGSDGNYNIAEDGTTQTFTITSSTVDLKAHVGHDVEVVGQKATVTTSSGSSDNRVVVTGVNMISEHCATASAATADAPAVTDSTPTATASTPAVADQTPSATANTPAVADPTPTATASAPMMASASAPENTERLPDTATSLPLLGLLGLGLLATGLLSRKSRTN
jgi:hypothetical protein